jgi:putative hemolysin
VSTLIADEEVGEAFAPVEKEMVRGVLTLAERPVQAIMTSRPDIDWLDPNDPKETILAKARASVHRQLLVSRNSIDEVIGFARKEEILQVVLDHKPFDLIQIAQKPVAVRAGASILKTLEVFKQRPIEMALVVDEYGAVQGVVTRTDLLAAIAGDLPGGEPHPPEVKELGEGIYAIDGALSIYDAQQRLRLANLPDGDFHTLAGLVLFLFGRLPAAGEHVQCGDWNFEVSELDGWRIAKVLARRTVSSPALAAAPTAER